MSAPLPASQLKREIGLTGAVLLGLGSILGTGLFVSIGLAAQVTGPSVMTAIFLAAGLALCNGLSSAQLAARLPVSGGTYEYGYHWLRPWLGFTAGWMFLCAKSASSATAALGGSAYLLVLTGQTESGLQTPVAVGLVLLITGLIVSGTKRTNRVNAIIVSFTLLVLAGFVGAGVWYLNGATSNAAGVNALPSVAAFPAASWGNFFQATALLFVAYTGYGRIATLGEEVTAPEQTIPRAIGVTLLCTAVLYASVALVGLNLLGWDQIATTSQQTSPWLVQASRQLPWPYITWLVSVAAITAMLGVLLNLILGLSRVLLAMGRRGDMPGLFSQISPHSAVPVAAVVGIGLFVLGLTLVGQVKLTWSFSAFTVLIYYAITNAAALQLTPRERLYSPVFAWLGLLGCLSLAFFVEPAVWGTGLLLIAVGLLLRGVLQRSSA